MSLSKRFKAFYYRTKYRFVNPTFSVLKPAKGGCVIQVMGDIAITDLTFSIRPGNFHQHIHRRHAAYVVDASDRYLKLGCRASIILQKPKVRTVTVNEVVTNYIAFVMYITDKYECMTITWLVEVKDTHQVTADELKWNIECDNNERAKPLISSPGGESQIRYRQLGGGVMI